MGLDEMPIERGKIMDSTLTFRAQCPVCGHTIAGEVIVCELCHTPHHQECWEYNCGCAMFGCREQFYRQSRCTMCGQSMTSMSFSDEVSSQRKKQLCRECVERKILASGRMVPQAVSIVGCAVLSLVFMSWSIVGGMFFLAAMVYNVIGAVYEMKRNADDLPLPPRLGRSVNKKDTEECL